MASHTLELSPKANVQGLVSGVRTARTAATNAGKGLDNFRRQKGQAWNTVGTTLATADTAVTAGVGKDVAAWRLHDCIEGTPRGSNHLRRRACVVRSSRH